MQPGGHSVPRRPAIGVTGRNSERPGHSRLKCGSGPRAYPQQRTASKNSMSHASKQSLFTLVFFISISCAPIIACAQTTGGGLPDNQNSSRPPTDDNKSPAAREVTWASLPKDFLRDQKNIWTFPVQLAKGHHWLPTLTISGVTAGLIVADPHVMPYFQDHQTNLDHLNDTFDSTITTAEVIAIPTTLMIFGYARHDSYQVSTAILAGRLMPTPPWLTWQ